jgi:hypothetical protein
MLAHISFVMKIGLVVHQQTMNWVPPETTLPREFVESVKFVLSHGFADPRGGSFSIATIKTSNIWNPTLQETRVRGWILPSKHGQQKIIVLPNGLSYPIVSVIRGADINEGLVEPLQNNEMGMKHSFDSRYSACACLLLTGNTSLAEKQFPLNNINPFPNTFMGISSEYLNRRFHRAVEAHMRGDDVLALADSSTLKRDYFAYEQEATRLLGIKYFENLARPDWGGDGKPIAFRTLNQLDALVADSSRRIQNHESTPSLEAILLLPKDKRIIELLRMLDQVSVRQYSQPGGVDLVVDPVVQAIVDIGNDAGSNLIDTIEFDKRLTRAVSFGRDFFPERNLLTVRNAALSALRAITGIDDFQGDGAALDVKKLRAYWTQYGSMTPSERWLATLADDSQSPRQWLAAAENIVDQRVYVTVAGGFRGYRENVSGPMRGESLRKKVLPSVTDVMANRARMLFGANNKYSSDSARYPLEMCIALARWNPDAALECLKDVSREIVAFAVKERSSFTFDYQGKYLADVFEIRHQLGDSEALSEYADFLIRMPHHSLSTENCRGIRLLAKYPNHPDCAKAIFELFEKDGSPWNIKESLLVKDSPVQVKYMLASPLIALGPFREVAKRMLSDKTIIGRVWREGKTIHEFTDHSNGTSQISDAELHDPSIVSDGESTPFRICDQFAEMFNRYEWNNAPRFYRYRTIAARDRTIEEIGKYIDEIATKVTQELKSPYNWEISPPLILRNKKC